VANPSNNREISARCRLTKFEPQLGHHLRNGWGRHETLENVCFHTVLLEMNVKGLNVNVNFLFLLFLIHLDDGNPVNVEDGVKIN
jgi:hypothetical protein